MIKFLNRFGFWISLVICGVVYLTLAYKNPFKDNNLISNLEPYPDTLLYSFPAWNWVRGNGWNLGVGEKIVNISVPNTYGYLLVPLMWLFKDIRSFYFTNLIFGLGSLLFFMLALKNFFGKEKWYLIGFFGFLLVTNFYFFNQPQLVMAENVNYLLVAVFLYLISIKFKWVHILPMFLLILLTYVLKFSNLVLAGGFLASFFIKIFCSKLRFVSFKKVGLVLGGLILVVLVLYLPKILSLSTSAFNFKYFFSNFDFYFHCLSGGLCRNLWYGQRLISWDIWLLFVLGLIVMLFNKDKRWLFFQIVIPLVVLVLAMSLFIDTEGRHVEILILIMLVVGCFGVDVILKKDKVKIFGVVALVGVNIFLTGYQTVDGERKIVSLKKQIGLNLRHREDPWNYLCLEMVNGFIKDKKEAYFGSFLPIYFFDAYGVKLNYLPLSAYQDFMLVGRGLQNYFSLPLKNIYQGKLNEGREIYLSDYYASNGRDLWRSEWNEIVSIGKLEKVYQSPLDNCNIYKLVESYKVRK